MPEFDIETLEDWNALLRQAGCCEMPSCLTPTKEYQCLIGGAESEGIKKPEDTVFKRYAKYETKRLITVSATATSSDPDIGSYTSQQQTSSADYKTVQAYTGNLFSAIIGSPIRSCESTAPTSTYECLSTGSMLLKSFNVIGAVATEGNPDPACPKHVYQSYELGYSRSVVSAGGLFCEDNIWLDSGTETTLYDSDPDCDGRPPVTTTISYYSSAMSPYASIGTNYTSFIGGIPATVTESEEYLLPVNYNTLRGQMKGWLTSNSNFSTAHPDCIVTNCTSSEFFVTPSSGNDDIEMTARVMRFRWKIPDGHLGSYFKITWDLLNEPTGWDACPPTATRSYYSEDQTYEWTGAAGGGTNRYSEYYEVPVPDFVGQRRVVNVRYECYRSNYGNKPQVTGEAVTLPDS